jgi:hypothetical protein
MSRTRVLHFSTEAMDGIAREVMAAFNSLPRRGAETGGLLLGRGGPDEVQIGDYEPLLCSHRYGPSFLLDEEDHRDLAQSLTMFAENRGEALPVAGLYRSNTRGPAAPDDRDLELFDRYFAGREALFLLLLPARDQSLRACWWKWAGGRMQPEAEAAAFPYAAKQGVPLQNGAAPSAAARADAPVPAPPAVPVEIPVVAAAAPAVIPPVAAPPPEPPADDRADLSRMNWTETAPRGSKGWLWLAAALLLVVPGAYLAFRAWRPDAAAVGNARMTPAAVPAPAAGPPAAARLSEPVSQPPAAASVPPPPSAPEPTGNEEIAETQSGRADREEPDPKLAVRKLLQDWAAAQRSGEPRDVAEFYAAQVSRYLGRRNVTRTDVSNQVAAFIGIHGIPVIFRLSDVRVEATEDGGAVATFRKHWQTRGARMYAGEEELQLRLVRQGSEWKIAAEDELRVYWNQALR